MEKANHLFARTGHRIVLALMALLFVGVFAVANPQQARAEFEVGLGAGWDGMILDGRGYDTTNNGLVFQLSAGFRFLGFLGVFVEQDLGYIRIEAGQAPIKLDERLFKGATIVDGRFYFSFLLLESYLKLGIGAMYMETLPAVKDDIETWFAFRTGLGVTLKLGSFRVGAELDYTLGSTDKNDFDRKDNTHFISVRGVLGYLF